MAETNEAKELIDNQFWQKFDALNEDAKTQIRLAFQQAERNLLAETQILRQEVDNIKTATYTLGEAA